MMIEKHEIAKDSTNLTRHHLFARDSVPVAYAIYPTPLISTSYTLPWPT